MTTSTPRSTTVNPPNWENQKNISVRALWEIAAMAGEVDPRIENVNRQKNIDPEWKAAYYDILRRMIDALTPTSVRDNNRINFDLLIPFNASIQGDRKVHRLMRVDVASACKFLEKTYGVGTLPAGLREVYKNLLTNDELSGTPANAQPDQVVVLSKSPASRDQAKGNETKKSNLLSIVLAAMALDLWGPGDGGGEPISMPDDIQSLLVKYKLTHIHGLRSDVIANAIRRGNELIKKEKR